MVSNYTPPQGDAVKATLTFECGERSCYVEKGKPCRFVFVRRFGTIVECGALNRELDARDEWLQRCPECLVEAKPVEEVPR